MKAAKQNQIFLRVFLSYLLILIVPFIITFLIYHIAVDTIAKGSKEQVNSMLDHAVYATSVKLKELETISYYIGVNTEVQEVLTSSYIDPMSSDIFKIYKACRSIPDYSHGNSSVKSIFVHMRKSPYIITQNCAVRVEDGRQSSCGNLSLDKERLDSVLWNKHYYNSYIQLSTVDNNSTFLINSIIAPTSNDILGVTLINIENSFFEDMLQLLQSDSKGLSYIVDGSGQVLFSSVGKDCPLGETFLLQQYGKGESPSGYQRYSAQLPRTAWSYYTLISDESLYGNTVYIKYILFGLGSVIAVAGVFLSYCFAHSNSSFCKRIVGYLGGSGYGSYEAIERSVSSLVQNNNTMREKLQLQRPLLEAAGLRQLLLEPFEQVDPAAFVGDFPKEEEFLVVLVQTRSFHGQALLSKDEFTLYSIKNLLKNSEDKVYMLDIDKSRVAVLLCSKGGSTRDFTKRCCQLFYDTRRLVCMDETCDLLFFMSDPDQGIANVHRAYCQALRVFKKTILLPEIYVYDENTSSGQTEYYDYPLETEMKLLQLSKQGNTAQVRELLTQLYIQNFVTVAHSNEALRYLVDAMRGSLLRSRKITGQNEKLDLAFSKLISAESTDEVFNCVVAVYTTICKTFDRTHNEAALKRAENMLAFIDSHFTDASFSIYDICKEYNLSETQAYQFFREVVGQTFADLLEFKRIELACLLLKAGGTSIRDIALSCGYSNDGSFRRAFKRSMGVSPREYMQAIG